LKNSVGFPIISSGCTEPGNPKGFRIAIVSAWFLFAGFAAIGVSVSRGEPVRPRYEVIDLGTLGGSYSFAYGINESGQVVGVSKTATQELHAFVWDKATGMIDLGTLGGNVSGAYAIDNRGRIAGSARTIGDELHAFLWENGKMTDLGVLPGGSCTEAMAINDAGQIVGMARTSAGSYFWQRAFLWENGKITDLGVLDGASNSSAADINIRGQVVGTSGNRAFLWDSTEDMTQLADSPSQANAINASGSVLLTSSGEYYILDSTSGLFNMNLPENTITNSINNFGQVVGNFNDHAFLWDDSYGMIDLNVLATAGSGWKELTSAQSINNGGQIVGEGVTTDQDQSHAFVMNPIPPESYLVAHWELDESSGSVAVNSAGNNNGVLEGNPQWQPYSGRMNGALLLDGNGDYLDCGPSPVFDIADEITVAAWVNINQVNMDWQAIVTKGDSSWRLSTAGSDMRFYFGVTSGGGHINGDTVVGAGEWHHVCGTYDGEYMRLYVDGIEEPGSPVARSTGISLNGYHVYIGNNAEENDRYWDGLIDDVRLYNCPLTATEVYDLFMAGPIYVDIDAEQVGANDGSSWDKAFDNLQDALGEAQDGSRIHVAAGIYTPDTGVGIPPGEQSATFQLIDGVALKGGFAGFGEPSPKSRDFIAHRSVLSGDLGENDEAGFVNMGENSYNVVTGSDTISTAVLEGFTISGGNAEIASGNGGGMLNVSGSPTVKDCIFTANKASRGGAMYNDQSNPRLENCLFAGNSVSTSTGGGDGGAIFCTRSSPTLISCIIRANTASRFGGGMASRSSSSPWIVNCVFNANSADNNGGGLHLNGGDAARATNCTFSQNHSGNSGGGIYSQNSTPVLVNCILQGNTDNGGSMEDAQIDTMGGGLTIDYSCVEGWSGALGGEGNIGADAHFVDADGPDNIPGTEDDDLRIDSGSACLNDGNNDAVLFVMTDLDGHARIMRDIVDMGAYEFADMHRWYVDGVNGSDNNNGLSPATAFATIQKGIDTADENCIVVVYPGVYQESVFFKGKAVTVTGEGSGATIIEDPNYAVTFQFSEDANSVLKNVVIRNCGEAGILIRFSSPTITNVTLVNNAVGIEKMYSSAMPDISNCILWNNANADLSCGDPGDPYCTMRYSCVERDVSGDNNINDNPMFADLAGGDYHLLSERGRHRPSTQEWILDDVTSPCVDGGEPWVDPSAERMPNGGRLNMGAFGGTYYASMSEWPLAGDINRDGVINMEDFALLAESWLSKLEWAE